MKALDRYILEKFQITKDSKIMYYPKDKFELRKILEERLSKDKDADLNDIDVSNITDMGYDNFDDDRGLFENLDPHNINISEWNVSNVINMDDMFWDCRNFNCDLSNWNVSNVINMNHMFWLCEKFKGQGLENWKPIKCENMEDMFYRCDSLKNEPKWYKN